LTRGKTSEAVNLSRLLSGLIFICYILISLGWEAQIGLINLSFTGLWKMADNNWFDYAFSFATFAAPFIIVTLIWHNLYKLKNQKLIGKVVYVSQHVTIAIIIFVYCLVAMVLANGNDDKIFFVTDFIMDTFGRKLLASLTVVGTIYGLWITIFPPRGKSGS